MNLIAVACTDAVLLGSLKQLNHPDTFLHPLNTKPTYAQLQASLETLNFAGAMIFEEGLARQIATSSQRPSIGVQVSGFCDTLICTPAGIIAENSFAQSVRDAFIHQQWDARGARAVVLGNDLYLSVIARELANLGVQQLVLLAENRPSATRALAYLPKDTEGITDSLSSPQLRIYLEQADIIVHGQTAVTIPIDVLGPHLSIIDLQDTIMSDLRRNALRMGARTLSMRDLRAYQVAAMLHQILGRPVSADSLLAFFHS